MPVMPVISVSWEVDIQVHGSRSFYAKKLMKPNLKEQVVVHACHPRNK
jgi:hypothetical protein